MNLWIYLARRGTKFEIKCEMKAARNVNEEIQISHKNLFVNVM